MLELVSSSRQRDDETNLDLGVDTPDDAISCEPTRLKVLVVEDDPEDYAIVERCLAYMSLYEPQITLAANAAAARFALGADTFDAILLDNGLDGESGNDLLPAIAGDETQGTAILVTGALSPQIRRTALKRGAAACLLKDDLSPEALETVLQRAIESRSLRSGLVAAGEEPAVRKAARG